MSVSPPVPIITLLTDFGSRDTYVGQLKGAILAVCPQARLVDLTHEIAPGDIRSAAVAWADAIPAFPPQTIHLGVVDPGVGTSRRGIAAEIGAGRFVCPDNGLLTLVQQMGPLTRWVELTEPRWWRPNVSAVFHGRDVFGPVAAHWAAGRSLTDFGRPSETPLVELAFHQPLRNGGILTGEVLTVDRFGNLRTNLPASWLAGPPENWQTEIAGRTISGLSRCFGDRETGSLVALIGSHGQLEIAVNRGNAAEYLGAAAGTSVLARHQE